MCGACCLGTHAGAGEMGVGEQCKPRTVGCKAAVTTRKKRVGFGQIVDFLFPFVPTLFSWYFAKKKREKVYSRNCLILLPHAGRVLN